VLVISNNDEVSSNKELSLQRWQRSLHGVSFALGGPPSVAQWVTEVVTAPRPDPSMMASSVVAPSGPSGGNPIMVGTVTTVKAIMVKEVADVAVVKRAMGDTATVKKIANDMAKAIEAAEKATEDPAGSGQTPTSVTGSKRAAKPSSPIRCFYPDDWLPHFDDDSCTDHIASSRYVELQVFVEFRVIRTR
jgi:hypothetical protein